MTDKKRKKLQSWLIVYAVMCVAVVFTTQSRALAPPGQGALSPVSVEGVAPVLNIDPIVRRSDL